MCEHEGQALVIYRLASRGYAVPLAVRVAMTPPLSVSVPVESDERPGLEIFESGIRYTPTVALTLLREMRGAS